MKEEVDKDLEQQENSVLNGINRIFKEAITCSTQEELGILCLNVVKELTQSTFGIIGEINSIDEICYIAISNDDWNAFKIQPIDFKTHCVYGRALMEGNSFIINQACSHPYNIENTDKFIEISSFLGIPLKDNNKTIGIIGLGNRKDGYTLRELKLVEAMAPSIVQAFKHKKSEEMLIQNQQQLKEQKENLEAIVSNISDGLIILDKDYRFSFLNESGKDFFYSPEAIKKSGDSFRHTKYFDMQGNELSVNETPDIKALKGQIITNERIKAVRPDKTLYYSVSGNPVYDENKEIKFALMCCRDITEVIKKDEEIKEQKIIFETVIENMHDAIAIYDKDCKLIFINAETRRLYPGVDMNATKCKANDGFQYFDFENNVISRENLPTMRAFRGEKIRHERIIVKRPDRIQYTEINGTPIFDERNNLSSVVIAHRDISELINKQLEVEKQQYQLLQAEKAKSEALEAAIKLKDEFLYLITHEFKTPMSVIYSALQAIDLICKDDISERLGRYLITIKNNTNRQLRLVNNLLDVTRINSGNIRLHKCNFDIVYVTKAILDSVEVYARQKKVDLNFKSSISEKEIYLDEEKFERIILNLLSNALKFTPQGKSINLLLSAKKHNNKKYISITVKDEGIGIPQDKQEIIFERFGQADTSLSRQAEGTGLGLYIVTLLLKELQGELTVESEIGKGSTFTVLLPEIEPISDEKEADLLEANNQFINGDSRIIQAVSIEFSDIYFD